MGPGSMTALIIARQMDRGGVWSHGMPDRLPVEDGSGLIAGSGVKRGGSRGGRPFDP